MTVLVFLHVPKTAGQSIHARLANLVGKDAISPVRTHTQALDSDQMPPGYKLYSGHIDWTELESLPEDRFVFTVLRDPKERIASFYFYLRKEAEKLSAAKLDDPQIENKRRVLTLSVDDYFFSGDTRWQSFVLDHYDNFYCSYFATRLMRGRSKLAGLDREEIITRAKAGLDGLDGVYHTDDLTPLERDISRVCDRRFKVVGTYVNTGAMPVDQLRWPQLVSLLEKDASVARLERLVEMDSELMQRIGAPSPTAEPRAPRRWIRFSR